MRPLKAVRNATEDWGLVKSATRLFHVLVELEYTFPLCSAQVRFLPVTEHLENFLTVKITFRIHHKTCPAIAIDLHHAEI